MRTAELRDPETIILSRLYPFTVARLFIQSSQSDGPITCTTLHNWRRAGRFEATYRIWSDGRRFWFVKGAQILLLLGIEPTVAKKKSTASPRASSRESLRDSGFKNV